MTPDVPENAKRATRSTKRTSIGAKTGRASGTAANANEPGEAARVIASLMPEKELQEAVMKMAKMYGWLAFHDHDSRRNPEGFPDCTLVRNGRVVFAELKTTVGRLTPLQLAWNEALEAAMNANEHVYIFVWRPSDLMYGRIEEVLR